MSTPLLPPGPDPESSKPGRVSQVLWAFVKGISTLLAVTAIATASAYGVVEWRMQHEQAAATAHISGLQTELRQRQDQLEAQISRVERAAVEAKLLLDQGGEVVSLESRLREIDSLRLELKKAQEESDAKLKALERSLGEQLAKQGQETALAVAAELRWKSLLIKAQGEVLLAQMHWAEGNRGLAKDQVGVAVRTLQGAVDEAPEPSKPALRQVQDLAEQARSALILEQSSARDQLNLLWHRVGDLLTPEKR